MLSYFHGCSETNNLRPMIDFIIAMLNSLDKLLWGPWTMLFIGGVAFFRQGMWGAFEVFVDSCNYVVMAANDK